MLLSDDGKARSKKAGSSDDDKARSKKAGSSIDPPARNIISSGGGGKAMNGQVDGASELRADRNSVARRAARIRRVAPPKRPAKALLAARQADEGPAAVF